MRACTSAAVPLLLTLRPVPPPPPATAHQTHDQTRSLQIYIGGLFFMPVDGAGEMLAYDFTEWTHMAIVFNGTDSAAMRVQLYINGSAVYDVSEDYSSHTKTNVPFGSTATTKSWLVLGAAALTNPGGLGVCKPWVLCRCSIAAKPVGRLRVFPPFLRRSSSARPHPTPSHQNTRFMDIWMSFVSGRCAALRTRLQPTFS